MGWRTRRRCRLPSRCGSRAGRWFRRVDRWFLWSCLFVGIGIVVVVVVVVVVGNSGDGGAAAVGGLLVRRVGVVFCRLHA